METLVFSVAVTTALLYILKLESQFLKEEDQARIPNEERCKFEVYDFIVVGGGSAGCIVANRLSKKHSVLLLEAGGDPPPTSSVPAFVDYVAATPEINYFYKSTPQSKAGGRVFTRSHGKMLGGSGSHNTLVYNRGNKKDYDNWAALTGDDTWSYNALLKYFKKAESYNGKHVIGSEHGTKGPLNVETGKRLITGIWEEAAKELGYKVDDPNGPQKEGFSESDVLRYKGRRVSTYTAYIQPYIKIRRNRLSIKRYSHAEKINFDSTKQASSVTYRRHGKQFVAKAKKEIIVSCGTIATPILLFKSGIGPKSLLMEANIKPIVNLPVGENLQDHFGLFLGPFNVSDFSVLTNIYNNLTEHGFHKYLKYEDEIILSETGRGPQAFFVSSIAKEKGEDDWPDIQIFLEATGFNRNTGASPKTPSNQFNAAILVGRPEFYPGLGKVTLDVNAYKNGVKENEKLAIIEPKYLINKKDYRKLKFGIDTALKIFSTKAFAKIGTTLIPNNECHKNGGLESDIYWDCYIQKEGNTWSHMASTCRMGSSLDSNSVVDSKLRLKGVKGLRIVDASVMPTVTNANTNAPTIVIAEKASDDIISSFK